MKNALNTIWGKVIVFNIMVFLLYIVMIFTNTKKVNLTDIVLITILMFASYILVKRYEEL